MVDEKECDISVEYMDIEFDRPVSEFNIQINQPNYDKKLTHSVPPIPNLSPTIPLVFNNNIIK